MKKILISVFFWCFAFCSVNVHASEVREYSFEDFYSICNMIYEKQEEIMDKTDAAIIYGDNYEPGKLNTIDRVCFYNFIENVNDEILKDCELKRNDVVRVSGFVYGNGQFSGDGPSIVYSRERSGLTILTLSNSKNEFSYSDVNKFSVRANEDLGFIEEGKYITVEGIFMPEGRLSGSDYLYDCKVLEIKDHWHPYYGKRMLYSCALDVVKSNLDENWVYPEFLDYQKIHIDDNGYMAEVSAYAENKNDGSLKKWTVVFTYDIDDSNGYDQYSYQTIYAYIDGFNPLGNYILVK